MIPESGSIQGISGHPHQEKTEGPTESVHIKWVEFRNNEHMSTLLTVYRFRPFYSVLLPVDKISFLKLTAHKKGMLY